MRGDDASSMHFDEGQMLKIRHEIVVVEEILYELGLYLRDIVKIRLFLYVLMVIMINMGQERHSYCCV